MSFKRLRNGCCGYHESQIWEHITILAITIRSTQGLQIGERGTLGVEIFAEQIFAVTYFRG